jgi:pilus assembly protein Flp/PilA
MSFFSRVFIKRFFQEQRGATAIEYGLIATGIALGIAVVVFVMGEELTGLFEYLSEVLGGAAYNQ